MPMYASRHEPSLRPTLQARSSASLYSLERAEWVYKNSGGEDHQGVVRTTVAAKDAVLYPSV